LYAWMLGLVNGFTSISFLWYSLVNQFSKIKSFEQIFKYLIVSELQNKISDINCKIYAMLYNNTNKVMKIFKNLLS